jgi:hypothetical protein
MSDSESGWATREWAAIPAAGSSFTIGYFVRETLKFLECVFTDTTPATIEAKPKGTVTVRRVYWHPLFIGFPQIERDELRSDAIQRATIEFGEPVRLYNLSYRSEWNGWSLLLYFSLLGWIENAILTADAYDE